jgi:hypothetical protein
MKFRLRSKHSELKGIPQNHAFMMTMMDVVIGMDGLRLAVLCGPLRLSAWVAGRHLTWSLKILKMGYFVMLSAYISMTAPRRLAGYKSSVY